MAEVAPKNIEKERGAKSALTDLVRLLARQAAREAFAEEQQASASPASPPTKMESDDGYTT